MSPIEIDESRSPVVVVRFRGAATDEEFRRYLEQMADLVERRQKTLVIMDARSAGMTPPLQRKMQADWLKERHVLLSQRSLGTAFIITSAMIRGILTAILWLSPMAAPHAVVETPEEADRWAQKRLREAGLG